MRGVKKRIGLLVAVLLGLGGCVNSDNQVRPPPRPEEYNSPPADDNRYVSPPQYPKDTLNKGLPRQQDDSQGPGGPGGIGNPSSGRGPVRPGAGGF